MDESHTVQRYVDAIVVGDEALARIVLTELRRCSVARVTIHLLEWLVDGRPVVARAAASAATATIEQAPMRSLWAMDRALRDGARGAMHGVAREHLTGLAGGPHGLGALALLSMQRNGYTRQDAVRGLASRAEPLVLRLLLLRLNDPVRAVSETACEAVLPWIERRRAPALVEVLPLLETMRDTVRAGHSVIAEHAERVLGSDAPIVRQALVVAAHGSLDEDVRISATRRLARRSPDEGVPALQRGLYDRSPRVRHALARFVERTKLPEELRQAVLPSLHDNASPSLRLLSLRLRRRHDSAATRQALLERSFDANAVVRFHARRMLRERGDESDFYGLAHRRLAERGIDSRALVGVLGVLSDIGRRTDIERVREFVEHPVGRVAAEARRTLGILEQG